MLKVFDYEPMRKNRFLVEFSKELQIEPWMVKSIDTPIYDAESHEWKNVEITFINPIVKSSSEALFKLIDYLEKIENDDSSLFSLYISMLDPTGVAVEKWEIGVKEVISIDFGRLDYTNDDIVTPKIVIKPLFFQIQAK